MAQAYAKVLASQDHAFEVIGRGEDRAAQFRETTGIAARTGGLDFALENEPAPPHAIVATGIDTLYTVTNRLIDAGTKTILVEKPAGLSSADVEKLAQHADARDCRIFVAYNRRFFASVIEAKRLIEADGGLRSLSFDFTEMADRVGSQERPTEVKERWLLANSTHVIDLAFHLAGAPQDWAAYQAGTLEWHPTGAVFAGAGTTERGVVFNYTANWAGPGRWALELVTDKRRMVLRPMERLFANEAALQAPEEVPVDLSLDQQYKPGLALQVRAFLAGGSDPALCSIQEHARLMPAYERIGGYA